MDSNSLLKFMDIAEKLKCNLRHSWTSSNRQESVAEHSWRLCVLTWILRRDFPDYDMDKVLLMCIFHDIGEALTGDIPSFYKTEQDEIAEREALADIFNMLDEEDALILNSLFDEIKQKETKEAKLLKALDMMEAVIQHNEAPLSTWLPLEFDLNPIYGEAEARHIPRLKELRKDIKEETLKIIEREVALDASEENK